MPIAYTDLSEDVRRYIKDGEERDAVTSDEALAAIGVAIANLRDEAKQARISSGIEARWKNAEDAYAGIDDVNRGELGAAQAEKSMSLQGPIQMGRANLEAENDRSTLYVMLTQRYTDAGAAKVGEILLAPGAKSFSISATPVPELVDAKDDKRQVLLDHLPGSPPAMRPAQPGELPIGAPGPLPPQAAPVPAPAGVAVPAAGAAAPAQMPPPGAPPTAFGPLPMPGMVPATVSDFAKETMESSNAAAKKAEKRIYDWQVECRRTAQVRKVIFDAARLGVGVLKGPVPKQSREKAIVTGEGGSVTLKIRQVIRPASKWVNSWNFYPDPTCGEDIQDGEYVFEREWMGERQVRALKKLPGYIGACIDRVVKEGPGKVNTQEGAESRGTGPNAQPKKGKFEVWYYHGTLTREEMTCICQAAGTEKAALAGMLADRDQVHALVTLINDSVVRATLNPLDSGEFPYHAMPWQRRAGSWAGRGIPEQLDTPQRMVTAATRSMLDNAGISAGGQIVIDASKVTPADGIMAMSPHKIWYVNGDESEKLDVNEMFQLFKVDNVTAQLMQIVEWGMRLAEESSSIPLITQGQSGPTTPDTYGAAALQNNNANQLLRAIGYQFDDYITEPEVNQYYEWLLLDPDVPNDEKGDWTIDAHGSPALVERALQTQWLNTIAPLVPNPVYGINPKKWMALTIEAQRLNPIDLQYTEEEQAKIDAQPPPAPPQVEVAKIRASVDQQKIAADTANAEADNAREDRKLATESTIDLHTLELKRELAILEAAQRQNTTVNEIKAQLAQTAMKVRAQKELSRDRGRGPQVLTPPTEPAGRAAPGRAYAQ